MEEIIGKFLCDNLILGYHNLKRAINIGKGYQLAINFCDPVVYYENLTVEQLHELIEAELFVSEKTI